MSKTYDLTRFVGLHFDGSQNRAAAWVLTTSYLCDILPANDWQHTIKGYLNSRCSAKKARLKLLEKGYFFALKMFLLEASRVKGSKDLIGLQVKYKITDRDFFSLRQDLKNEKFSRKLRARTKGIKNLDWSKPFYEAYGPVLKYVKYVAYNKLRFIAKSNNANISDLYPELIEVALKSFHRLWPTSEGPSYIANYLKRSVHNRAINFIKYSTTQKRGRLVNVGKTRSGENQFSLLEVGEAKFTQRDGDHNLISLEDLQSESDRNSIQLKFELTLSVKAMLERYGSMPKKLKFLQILLGEEDEGFSTWLRWRNFVHKEETNLDFQDKATNKVFVACLSKYLHVDESKCIKFLTKLGTQLGYDESECQNDRYETMDG